MGKQARRGAPLASLEAIAEAHRLRRAYPPAVRAEAEAWVGAPGVDDPALADHTTLPYVTIDNDDSRDLDQALCIERIGGDGPAADRGEHAFRVRYALADASYYVGPDRPGGAALFAEALRRGATYYFPGWAVPMLPASLSEGVVSLNPRVLRRAVVFTIDLDGAGEVLHTGVERARIRSRAQLTYHGVQALYDAWERGASHPLQGQPFTQSLLSLREVGRLRIARAQAAGVVRYDRIQVVMEATAPPAPAGHPRFRVFGEARNDTERYNEQISLLVNAEGARLLKEARGPEAQPIFRVHPAPDEPAYAHLARQIQALVKARALDPTVWRWRHHPSPTQPAESLAAYLARLPRQGSAGPIFRAVQRQALLVNHRSTFAPKPGLHFGVGVQPYARFSSPMREIVGIFTHKELLEELGLAPSRDPQADAQLREQVIQTANHAKDVQRSITKACHRLALDDALASATATSAATSAVEDPAPPPLTGTVLGLDARRVFVALDAPPLEVKAYVEDLQEADGVPLHVDEAGVSLLGPGERPYLALGDRVTARVLGRNASRWRLALSRR